MELRVNSVPASFGDELREARDAYALTQQEIADRIGVSTRTVQYWEAGNSPRPKHRRAIVEFLRSLEAAA